MEKFDAVYAAHFQAVYRFLLGLCRSAPLAEELCQETFCQALRQLGSFRGDCTPQVWLCAIAKRLWYKELERRKPGGARCSAASIWKGPLFPKKRKARRMRPISAGRMQGCFPAFRRLRAE